MPFSLGISTISTSLHISLAVNNFRCDPGWRWLFLSTFFTACMICCCYTVGGGGGGNRGICVIALVIVLKRKENSCECLVRYRSFGRCGISFEFRESCASLYGTIKCLRCLVSFISFLYRSLSFLACTLLQCLDVMQWWILGTFYTVFLLHTCVIAAYFLVSAAPLESWRVHTQKDTLTQAPDHIHTWCASFSELWIPISFFYLCDFRERDRDRRLDGCEFRKVQVSVGTRITDKSCMLVRSNLYVHFRSSQLNHTDSEWNAVFAFQSRNVHSFIHTKHGVFFFSNDSSVSTLYTYSSSPFSLSICVRRTRRDFSLYIRFSVEA